MSSILDMLQNTSTFSNSFIEMLGETSLTPDAIGESKTIALTSLNDF